MPLVSVIIPVHNKWELTRVCLKTLAATTSGQDIEVLVIDNASTDVSREACPFAGTRLFGDRFLFIRNEANRNFWPASNQGAERARGEYLLFLSNATELLPGWLPPLLEDFQNFPDIAGTGPVLLCPEIPLIGHTVHHLGVCVSPFRTPLHTYSGIPAASPLARRRRFFQAISGACLLMPRQIFWEAGGFDERDNNGSADVELCARVAHKGRRFTINPESRVLHHESQTPGKTDDTLEAANLRPRQKGNLPLLHPDWREHVMADGLELRLGTWQFLQPALPSPLLLSLHKLAPKLDFPKLRELLFQHPYWEEGWLRLGMMEEAAPHDHALRRFLFKLFTNPQPAIAECAQALAMKDRDTAKYWLQRIEPFSATCDAYLSRAKQHKNRAEAQHMPWLAQEYTNWITNGENFKNEALHPFLNKFLRFNRSLKLCNAPQDNAIYAAWLEAIDFPARAHFVSAERDRIAAAPGISLLMLVDGPDHALLGESVRSLLGQRFADWELIAVHDGEAAEILAQAGGDARVRALPRAGARPGAALNAAMDRGAYPWVAVMGQHDLLTPDALAMLAAALAANPGAQLFYAGEDRMGTHGQLSTPYFKAGWDPLLALQQDYVHRLAAFRRDKVRALGGFREKFALAYEYDLLLRYCHRLRSHEVVHIPQVLYHCREGSGHGVIGVDPSPELAAEGLEAVRDYLRAVVQESDCEPGPDRLCRITWPRGEAKIAVLCDMTGSDAQERRDFCACWHEADEILLLTDATEELGPNVRVLSPPEGLSAIGRLNWAAPQAKAEILGFVKRGVSPARPGWTREIAGFSGHFPAGAWAGKLTSSRDGRLAHAGYLGDAYGNLRPLFRNADPARVDWFNWGRLSRAVAALGGECLFTRRETFLQNTGFDAELGEWAYQDYCLRLGRQGLLNAWLASAGFTFTKQLHLPAETTGFIKKWEGDFPAFNENIIIAGAALGLTSYPWLRRNANERLRDFSTRDYCHLYLGGGGGTMEPLDLYFLFGIKERFKIRRSHLDYSGHTEKRIRTYQAAPKNGIVVCTALTGAYEKLLPPVFIDDHWRYVCYTDQAREGWGIWEMRNIPYENADPRRRARWIKTNLPRLFPDARRVIWIDANIILTADLAPIVAQKEDCPLALVEHASRDCIFEEGEICIVAQKDEPALIHSQLEKYEREGMPRHFGLYETNIMLLDPKNELIKKIFAEWSEEILQYSKRDQISLPYVLYKNSFTPCNLLWPGVNMRNYKGCENLAHSETEWLEGPTWPPLAGAANMPENL